MNLKIEPGDTEWGLWFRWIAWTVLALVIGMADVFSMASGALVLAFVICGGHWGKNESQAEWSRRGSTVVIATVFGALCQLANRGR